MPGLRFAPVDAETPRQFLHAPLFKNYWLKLRRHRDKAKYKLFNNSIGRDLKTTKEKQEVMVVTLDTLFYLITTFTEREVEEPRTCLEM